MSPLPGYSGFTLQTDIKVLIKALERRRLALSSHKGGGLAGDLMVGREGDHPLCELLAQRTSYE